MPPMKKVQRTCRFTQLILDPTPQLVLGQKLLTIAITCIKRKVKIKEDSLNE